MRGRTARSKKLQRYDRWLMTRYPDHRIPRCVYRDELRRWWRQQNPYKRTAMAYDFDGRPLDLYPTMVRRDASGMTDRDRWLLCLMTKEQNAYPARIDETMIGPYRISTVWIGMHSGFGPRPMIYETMVFRVDDREGDPLDKWLARAPRAVDAKRVHRKVVRMVERRVGV